MRARIFENKGHVLERSPYVFMSYNLRMSLAGLLLFVLAGTGTVSAAQGALPGDILYPIKISVNEKVEVALAPTPAARAEVQVRLANRRVEEAQMLSSHGRLDKKTAETLTVDFDEHAAQAIALTEPEEQAVEDAPAVATTTLEREKQSVKKSSEPRETLRASLKIKAELLKEIKIRSQRQEIKDSSGEDGGIKVELQIGR